MAASFSMFCHAQTPDPNVAMAEKMLAFVRADNADSLYSYMADEVRGMVKPESLKGIMANVEAMAGKYKGHGAWEVQTVMGTRAYVSMLQFENAELAMLIVFNDAGRMLGIQILPPEAVKKLTSGQPLPPGVEQRADTVVTGRWRMPAVITYPAGEGPFPMVVMVHGSGPLDRDETIGPNHPFRDIALGLARCGVASLRYDKRTYAYPASAKAISIYDETIDDALTALRMAFADPKADTARIVLLGHSLGGTLAPLIAARSAAVGGMVVMAGAARPMAEVVGQQLRYLSPSGASDAYIDTLAGRVKAASPQYFTGLMAACSPADSAAALSRPVLVMQGERDYQVTMADFQLWQQRLGGCSRAVFRSYPKLNHLFLEGDNAMSNPVEYNIPGTVPDYVIDDMAAFVRSLSGRRPVLPPTGPGGKSGAGRR